MEYFKDQLINLIKNNDVDNFKIYYNEYINNCEIFDYFTSTGTDCYLSNEYCYPLCKCNNVRNIVHTKLYSQKCNCVDGKRYIILLRSLQQLFNSNSTDIFELYCDIKSFDIIIFNRCIKEIFKSGPIFMEYHCVPRDGTTSSILQKNVYRDHKILKNNIKNIKNDLEIKYIHNNMKKIVKKYSQEIVENYIN